ncbi:MAG: response regulator transcription factor [Verrucomicrobia bacterium]|nr:response regulator transcription factor [Verrucomicrobiota bacterium]
MKNKILLVDDHELIRRGLREFIEAESDFEVCAEAGTARDALLKCSAEGPDIALIDLSLGADSGLELIKDIAVRFPDTKMLVVSMQDEKLYAERVLRAGASGFVGKDVQPGQLVEAIRCVLSGKLYASDAVVQRIMQSVRGQAAGTSPVAALSDRELAVFESIGKGVGTASIAEMMSLSVKTIETYRARIKSKLNIGSSAELVQYAVQWTLEKS